MDFDKLPSRFRREQSCAFCKSKMDLFEVFLDEDGEPGVVTNFKCPKCENIYGMVYSGGHVDAYKKALAMREAPDIYT